MSMGKREVNGNAGESRTAGLLQPGFWLLTRSPDVDGTDFLIQEPADGIEALRARSRKIEAFGIVQVKYFEGRNAVLIAREYVLDGDDPRPEFFAILHTDSEHEESIHYFFTAKEISTIFELTSDGKHYRFAITEERKYTENKGRSRKDIRTTISLGIRTASAERNETLIRNCFSFFALPTQHRDLKPDFVYKLRHFEGTRVVIFSNSKKNESRLLDMRRDLYQCQDDYFWGDLDSGCNLLAVSIVAHHCDGAVPNDIWPKLLYWRILSELDSDCDHEITSKEVAHATDRPLFPQELMSYCAWERGGIPEHLLLVKKVTAQQITVMAYSGFEFVIRESQHPETSATSRQMLESAMPSIESGNQILVPKFFFHPSMVEFDSDGRVTGHGALGPLLRID